MLLVDLIQNWKRIPGNVRNLIGLIVIILVSFAVGLIFPAGKQILFVLNVGHLIRYSGQLCTSRRICDGNIYWIDIYSQFGKGQVCCQMEDLYCADDDTCRPSDIFLWIFYFLHQSGRYNLVSLLCKHQLRFGKRMVSPFQS